MTVCPSRQGQWTCSSFLFPGTFRYPGLPQWINKREYVRHAFAKNFTAPVVHPGGANPVAKFMLQKAEQQFPVATPASGFPDRQSEDNRRCVLKRQRRKDCSYGVHRIFSALQPRHAHDLRRRRNYREKCSWQAVKDKSVFQLREVLDGFFGKSVKFSVRSRSGVMKFIFLAALSTAATTFNFVNLEIIMYYA